MDGLLKLIPLVHKLIPDADKAREVAGQIHLAAISKIDRIAYSILAFAFGVAILIQCYQVEQGGVWNWLTFTVKLMVLGVLLGVEAKKMRDYAKLAQEIKKDVTGT